MKELPERIHDDTNGLDYVLVGDYYIHALRLTEESRPIRHWGRSAAGVSRKFSSLSDIRGKPVYFDKISVSQGH